MKSFLVSFFLFLPLSVWCFEIGSEVPAVALKNQFDETMSVSASTKKLLFTADKKASAMMNEYLQAHPKKLEATSTLYVSDISKMPAMITKMFALPAMKEYPYKIALDQDGEITKQWPREKEKLSLIELSNQKVVSIRYLQSKEEIAAAFVE